MLAVLPSSWSPREQHPLLFQIAGCLIPFGLFAAGLSGAVRRFRHGPRTAGLWIPGAFHLAGAVAISAFVVLGFKTEMRLERDAREEPVRFTIERYWWGYMTSSDGYADRAGNVLITARYDFACSFHEGLAVVQQGKLHGVIDPKGEWVIPPRFEDSGYLFTEGMLAVKLGGKWGFIDRTGKMVIEPRFDGLRFFSEGLAAFNVGGRYGAWRGEIKIHGGRWGFIDRTGRVVIEPRFLEAWYFRDGLADVKTEDGRTQIRRDGTLLPFPPPPEPKDDEN